MCIRYNVNTILDSSCTGTITIPVRASVHTWERWFQGDFCTGAKLCCANLETGASHIRKVLCHTLVWQCEQAFRPYWNWISSSKNWNPLRRKKIFKSKDWDLVRQDLLANRSGTLMFDVSDQLVPVLFHCCSYYTVALFVLVRKLSSVVIT